MFYCNKDVSVLRIYIEDHVVGDKNVIQQVLGIIQFPFVGPPTWKLLSIYIL